MEELARVVGTAAAPALEKPAVNGEEDQLKTSLAPPGQNPQLCCSGCYQETRKFLLLSSKSRF